MAHESWEVESDPFRTLYTLDDPNSRMRPRGYKALIYEKYGDHYQIDVFTDARTLMGSDLEVSTDTQAKNLPLNWLLQ